MKILLLSIAQTAAGVGLGFVLVHSPYLWPGIAAAVVFVGATVALRKAVA